MPEYVPVRADRVARDDDGGVPVRDRPRVRGDVRHGGPGDDGQPRVAGHLDAEELLRVAGQVESLQAGERVLAGPVRVGRHGPVGRGRERVDDVRHVGERVRGRLRPVRAAVAERRVEGREPVSERGPARLNGGGGVGEPQRVAPRRPALIAKFTTVDAVVEPTTTTSAVAPVPIWMVAPAVYCDGGAAARVQCVAPTGDGPGHGRRVRQPGPDVDRSPNTLSKK